MALEIIPKKQPTDLVLYQAKDGYYYQTGKQAKQDFSSIHVLGFKTELTETHVKIALLLKNYEKFYFSTKWEKDSSGKNKSQLEEIKGDSFIYLYQLNKEKYPVLFELVKKMFSENPPAHSYMGCAMYSESIANLPYFQSNPDECIKGCLVYKELEEPLAEFDFTFPSESSFQKKGFSAQKEGEKLSDRLEFFKNSEWLKEVDLFSPYLKLPNESEQEYNSRILAILMK